jgi:hypothetical protein
MHRRARQITEHDHHHQQREARSSRHPRRLLNRIVDNAMCFSAPEQHPKDPKFPS